MRNDTFNAIGEVLFGTDWRRKMAVALGRHYPSGARETLDHGLIARWAKGTRRIPDWVPAVLIVLLQDGKSDLATRIERMDDLVEEMHRVHSKIIRERMAARAKEQAET